MILGAAGGHDGSHPRGKAGAQVGEVGEEPFSQPRIGEELVGPGGRRALRAPTAGPTGRLGQVDDEH
jgi:hypothetical protein